jgi:hypothetical protein
MPHRQPDDTPPEYPAQDLAAKWRDLARYAAACIDLALDSGASESYAILNECMTVMDGAIAELEASAEGRAA